MAWLGLTCHGTCNDYDTNFRDEPTYHVSKFTGQVGLENAGNLVLTPGVYFKLMTTITLVAGTTFLMWLGEQITSRGIGNGISLIIFSGIVAEIPRA